MPRPPILPTIDWQNVFEAGRDYATWLANAESTENRDRMEQIRAGVALTPQVRGWLGGLERPVHVVAIAEDWCGDVVRHAPVLAALAEAAPNLRVRFIAREDHPLVFARFLTNGGEAIPKFIFLSENFVETGNWGPMPESCRVWIARGKAAGDVGAARGKVKLLYETDAHFGEVIGELTRLIDIAATARI